VSDYQYRIHSGYGTVRLRNLIPCGMAEARCKVQQEYKGGHMEYPFIFHNKIENQGLILFSVSTALRDEQVN